MRTVTLYYAFDNTTFETADECRAYEAANIANQLVGLTQEQVARAISREDTELADAIEEVGKRIANARRDSGELRRRRAVAADQPAASPPGDTPPTAVEQPAMSKAVTDLMYPGTSTALMNGTATQIELAGASRRVIVQGGVSLTDVPDEPVPTTRSPEPDAELEEAEEPPAPAEPGLMPIDSPTGPWRYPMAPRNDEERGRAARRAGRAKPDMTDPDYSLNLAIGWTYEDGVMKKEGPRAA